MGVVFVVLVCDFDASVFRSSYTYDAAIHTVAIISIILLRLNITTPAFSPSRSRLPLSTFPDKGQKLGHEYDATDDCCADSRDKDGTCRTILGFLRERMDVRRSKIDHRLNGGIQTFKRHDKRTADDNSRPFASVDSQPRAKHSYCLIVRNTRERRIPPVRRRCV